MVADPVRASLLLEPLEDGVEVGMLDVVEFEAVTGDPEVAEDATEEVEAPVLSDGVVLHP